MIILFLNCGSSSVRYSVYDWARKESLAAGLVERVTMPGTAITHERPGKDKVSFEKECKDHTEAVKLVVDTLINKEYGVINDVKLISAVGHRIVHGGKFAKSVLVDDAVMKELKEISDLAPLHNPAHIMGIEAAQKIIPGVKNICIMDTAFHQTMPDHVFMYALPYEWYTDLKVRRYGFHGSSVLYCAKRAAVLLGKKSNEVNVIVCHIGNGASITAVKEGKCFDTSMGLTPLEGLVMGTRSGDIDPAIPFYVMSKTGVSPDDMYNTLNKGSGVLAVSGKSADRRDVELAAEAGDQRCQLAVDMESYRIKKYIGAYAAALGRVDAVVWTAGVGERGPVIREKALRDLEYMGLEYDHDKNFSALTKNAESEITAPNSKVKSFVIPTDEEIVGVEDIVAILENRYDVHTKYTYIFEDKNYRNKLRDELFAKEIAKKPFLLKAAVNVPENIKNLVK
ncbi:Acetate kinase [Elusimicrobium minutum Pei191]|uniref:Acetate kinase n=1 Tax=Elusimicrobium minutum (strain Pei191) TaxID=445932 RepID=B2KCM9_ELUMP|nr:acetate kinase [Elusimicrobium minutum]ACC98275.1 Acetate kinase [Elusimicrobium minutum Pei191]